MKLLYLIIKFVTVEIQESFGFGANDSRRADSNAFELL